VQKFNKDSLFSALISRTTNGVEAKDIHLDIPDLPEDTNIFNWQIPTR